MVWGETSWIRPSMSPVPKAQHTNDWCIKCTLTQNENFTLYFFDKCFVSIHVIVRFTHAYRDFVADNDYAIFIQIPGLFKYQRLENVFRTLHVLRNRWVINSFKTDKNICS